MDDRTLVSGQSCNIGINMQRVRISVESIKKSLIDKGLILKDYVGVAVRGWGKDCTLSSSLEPTSSKSTGEDCSIDVVGRRLLPFLIDEISSDP